MYDVEKIRADFPILHQDIYPNVPLVYLDSAASAQKPTAVIDTMNHYYRTLNANVHRGIHRLSETATVAYEEARIRIAGFINAPDPEQLIFVSNATEGFNLVAATWGRANIQAGDVIILTEMEHHANIVPWQMVAAEKGATIRYLPLADDGTLDLSPLPDWLNERVKLVSVTAVSNVLGTINPVKEIIQMAHSAGAVTMVDAAQSVPHMAVDVQDLDCDFLTFSGHKMCGPTGSGILYGKRDLLENMPPYMGGGDMIRRVTFDGFTTNDLPYKFEAGTPSIAEGIGLGTAVDYLQNIGMEMIHQHEHAITKYALEALSDVPNLTLIGPSAQQRAGVASFTIDGLHPHDIAEILDKDGIAVRAGHHCAMPLHQKLGLSATARASFYLYNTRAEVDQLVASLHRARKIFRL